MMENELEQMDICAIVRKGQEEDYDFVNNMKCPLTASVCDDLIVISVFIAKMKCPNCNHYEWCKLRKRFNI